MVPLFKGQAFFECWDWKFKSLHVSKCNAMSSSSKLLYLMAKTSQSKKQLLSFICHILGIIIKSVVETTLYTDPPNTGGISYN